MTKKHHSQNQKTSLANRNLSNYITILRKSHDEKRQSALQENTFSRTKQRVTSDEKRLSVTHYYIYCSAKKLVLVANWYRIFFQRIPKQS